MNQAMECGTIVEYIDRQKVMCAVILEVKNNRLHLLTENNRELNLPQSRPLHFSKKRLDLAVGRDRLVESLRELAVRRTGLAGKVDVQELWEVLRDEQQWIDLSTMTELCFPDTPSGDHESAVVRALFTNRIYFKFDTASFFPYSEDQVCSIISRQQEEDRKTRIIEEGGEWLRAVVSGEHASVSEDRREQVEILKSLYLLGKESPSYELGKAMVDRAGVDPGEGVFQVLLRLGIWSKDENLQLYLFDIPTRFTDQATDLAARLGREREKEDVSFRQDREDLTHLPLITIDGASTLDFDDALSLEEKDGELHLGVHIADVGHFIRKGDAIDQEALGRASSIYMPDRKIPMVPPVLAEDLCSLRAGALRPAISLMIRLDRFGEILDYRVFPSVIRIKHQLTYYDVNQMAEEDPKIAALYNIAKAFRKKRLIQNAVHISLPEVNIWLDEAGNIILNRINRESPARMLVSEIMIMANWLMARFLGQQGMAAIFRSQPEAKNRLYKGDNGTLFQNWMQRKHLSRFVLGPEPERHSGLGLDAYVTATSPIRKYSDLVTQRQLRAIFGLEEPYGREEIQGIIRSLEEPMAHVSRIQFLRSRYWILRYLEGRVGQKETALVLGKRKNGYQILLTDYMLECLLSFTGSVQLRPEDETRITIQHADARKDLLSLYLG